ncbi:unnamed protein product [Cylicocyclus nassatus]|uniref:Uncharacterized protein n=1 Tax=Cylicocyclus nassatus TaxID=53992 RepID=A0AA36H4X1_CYLNA|nr:unnamed protein product [Cylicocyclus nassatus]
MDDTEQLLLDDGINQADKDADAADVADIPGPSQGSQESPQLSQEVAATSSRPRILRVKHCRYSPIRECNFIKKRSSR